MQDAVKRVAIALSGSGAFALAAAWVAYWTGDEKFVRGETWRTHADASIVLLVLGLLLLGNGFGALVWHQELAEDRKRLLRRDGRTEQGLDGYAGD
jgi:hypothetical protein